MAKMKANGASLRADANLKYIDASYDQVTDYKVIVLTLF